MKIRQRKTEEEQDALRRLVDAFRFAMHGRMVQKMDHGWYGWDDKKTLKEFGGGLKERIIKNALEEDWIDVANLAMMAWNMEK